MAGYTLTEAAAELLGPRMLAIDANARKTKNLWELYRALFVCIAGNDVAEGKTMVCAAVACR